MKDARGTKESGVRSANALPRRQHGECRRAVQWPTQVRESCGCRSATSSSEVLARQIDQNTPAASHVTVLLTKYAIARIHTNTNPTNSSSTVQYSTSQYIASKRSSNCSKDTPPTSLHLTSKQALRTTQPTLLSSHISSIPRRNVVDSAGQARHSGCLFAHSGTRDACSAIAPGRSSCCLNTTPTWHLETSAHG